MSEAYFEFTMKHLERKRKLKPTVFSPGKLSEYSLVSYAQGDKLDMCKTLTLDSFNEVIFIQESENIKNKKVFTHAMGYLNGRPYFLVLKAK